MRGAGSLLPERTSKPREVGLTCLNDVGQPTGHLAHLLADFSDYVDIAKLGVGSAYVYKNLPEKIALYRQHDVDVCFGGTLFEKFHFHNALDRYLDYLREHEIKIIEVSTGTIALELEERLELVQRLVGEFTVIAEVGSKDVETITAPSQWIHEINSLLKAGCRYVITEGRDSGSAGIYRPNGEIRMGLMSDILDSCDVERIIFEAPQQKAQMWFINAVGPNVNLGNIRPEDALILEAERVGLRYETFHSK